MPSIFTQIIQGKIPCHKILEDEKYFSFLEIKPINPGHTLVIPKQEIDYFFDLEDELLSGLMIFSKRVSHAIQKAIPCEKIGVMIYGMEVRHAHVHLIPILGVRGELNFLNAKPTPQEELAQTAQKIRAFL
ncbi:MAG: HIT family protein [Chlamydiae bacterium]|nr:HIT family protein [Chlamydiota bacterium]MBI3277136.1 HIT family protein [Chlamydiota bacterium]